MSNKEKTFDCDICDGKVFKSQQSFYFHLRQHYDLPQSTAAVRAQEGEEVDSMTQMTQELSSKSFLELTPHVTIRRLQRPTNQDDTRSPTIIPILGKSLTSHLSSTSSGVTITRLALKATQNSSSASILRQKPTSRDPSVPPQTLASKDSETTSCEDPRPSSSISSTVECPKSSQNPPPSTTLSASVGISKTKSVLKTPTIVKAISKPPESTSVTSSSKVSTEKFVKVSFGDFQQPTTTTETYPRLLTPKFLSKSGISVSRVQVKENGPVYYDCEVCRKLYSTTMNIDAHMMRHMRIPRESQILELVKSRGQAGKVDLSTEFAFSSVESSQLVSTTITKYKPIEQVGSFPREMEPKYCPKAGITVKRIQKEPNGPLFFDCPICKQLFSCSNNIEKHLLIHKKEAEAPAPVYPKELKPTKIKKIDLNVRRFQLCETGAIKFECEICKELFGSLNSLETHWYKHKGIKPKECKFCGKRFRQHSILRSHIMSSHTEKKAYQCEFCGKEFAMKFSLNIHLKVHTGVRDYVCEVCGQGFRASMYLITHRRLHTGEKPYVCDFCGHPFRTHTCHKRHVLNVHFKGDRAAAARYKKDKKEKAEAAVIEAGKAGPDKEVKAAVSESVLVEVDGSTPETISVMEIEETSTAVEHLIW